MYLNADFPGGRSRHARGKTLKTAVKEAVSMLNETCPDCGQVIISTSYSGDVVAYVVKPGFGLNCYVEPHDEPIFVD